MRGRKNDTHLNQKLEEYRRQYSEKEKALNELLENLAKEKENEIQKIRENFEAKKTNLSVIPVNTNTNMQSQYVQSLRSSGQIHAAIQQETEELNQSHFAKSRELESRIALLDKQCEIRVSQVTAMHDEYIAREKKNGEKELAKINNEYEKLKLYITRLNRK